ncbi:MAG: phosphoribosylformylglycinamidine synthase [Ruminococcaceae bacterium]|nr:phosphoribosylformylglycinamidine synthase [Oscillospiraceae bacterium]
MVYRVYVEKKEEYRDEARSLKSDVIALLGIKNLKNLRVLNRYDVEGTEKELFDYAVSTVFSEPQTDNVFYTLPQAEKKFATEYLPGQFDQRADSAAQCIQLISQGERPYIRTAKVYLLEGDLIEEEIKSIKKYVINPVESREASFDLPETIKLKYDLPTKVDTVEGFREADTAALKGIIDSMGLAMDIDDITFCRDYFIKENRDPTVTEIKMIDTYWSDHCRHTTFLTTIDNITFEDKLLQSAYEDYVDVRRQLGRTKPVNLMDIATIAVKYLKENGKLCQLDESEEINACTVKIKVNIEGKDEDWLLLFKNETHNHPTEIEPFGGAATCIGGAIRDPLSGRSYVYAAMRVTGAGNPLKAVEETLPGKLPQRKIVTTAANGYSSYGNQIGLATGQVDEIYHDGYVAKRMEIGAVIAAAPAENVRRERPNPGDIVILLGGRTGRDGCGGATGSSKSHTLSSLEACGAEVQKGNAPEERKLQRLFRNKEAARLIKRCNDFGAGGVSVAVGELADGLEINLNAVPKKYEGLDGTELAISESQERMAVVVEKEDVERFIAIAESENLEATVVAEVKAEPRLVMNWNGTNIVDISREFLDSNGAEKHIEIETPKICGFERKTGVSFTEEYEKLAGDLNVCSKRGLSERFDSTIGRGTVLMPFGGKYQLTPSQAMVHKISAEKAVTDTCSFMAWGYNPFITEKSPYHGAYLAVVESVSKLIASGASFSEVYLTFQEYFEKPGKDPKRWGKPLAALLGAFEAQKDYEIGAIGGKDSMSGSFENIDVPPTLVSFAVTTGKTSEVVSPEFKGAGHKVVWLRPKYDNFGLPLAKSEKMLYNNVNNLIKEGKVLACYTPTYGGVAEAVMKMSFGNMVGFDYNEKLSLEDIFGYSYGSFIVELENSAEVELQSPYAVLLGETTNSGNISFKGEALELKKLSEIYESKLEPVYSCNIEQKSGDLPKISYTAEEKYSAAVKIAKPRVLIPVFPGTNCEYDTAKALEKAGAEPEIIVIKNLSAAQTKEAVKYFAERTAQSQIVFIPGGFSGGDEPDGSGKFITAFFRNGEIKEQIHELLKNRDGLMGGICNGFQALIKLGLASSGEITDPDENSPTLTFNTIGRHQSKIVRTVVSSNKSPWLMNVKPGEIYSVPISHGEGRFVAPENVLHELAKNGQIFSQYVDFSGNPTSDIAFNPNNSSYAVEGIVSPDGRVFGKMGHSERYEEGLYKNVEGNYDMGLFESAVKYYK